jgi:hypothetical protein
MGKRCDGKTSCLDISAKELEFGYWIIYHLALKDRSASLGDLKVSKLNWSNLDCRNREL